MAKVGCEWTATGHREMLENEPKCHMSSKHMQNLLPFETHVLGETHQQSNYGKNTFIRNPEFLVFQAQERLGSMSALRQLLRAAARDAKRAVRLNWGRAPEAEKKTGRCVKVGEIHVKLTTHN